MVSDGRRVFILEIHYELLVDVLMEQLALEYRKQVRHFSIVNLILVQY